MLTETQKRNLRKLKKRERLERAMDRADELQAQMERIVANKDRIAIEKWIKVWLRGDKQDMKDWQKEYGNKKYLLNVERPKLKAVKGMKLKRIKGMKLKPIKGMKLDPIKM